MKILIVSEMSIPHATGGGETRYGLLARQLVALGHEITWLSMKQRQSGDEEFIDGVRHVHRGPRIAAPPTRSLISKLRFMVTVLLHVLRHRYDVVDCQTYAPLPAAWLACKLVRRPLVATIHDTSAAAQPARGSDQWLSAGDQLIASSVERWLYCLSYSRVLTVSRAVQDDLVSRMGVASDRVSVVHNAIDTERIDAIAAAPTVADLIFVGRMVPHKHPEAVLQVAAAINRRRLAAGRPSLRLKMIGGGPLAVGIRALAGDLGLADGLEWLGEVQGHDEVIAHIKAARVLLLPSTREGFGLVLAEAMACRTDIAAYRIAPVTETLGPELQDCLVETGDLDQLARVVETSLDDEGERATRIECGRNRVVAAFGTRRFAQEVLGVYRAAIEGAGARSLPAG